MGNKEQDITQPYIIIKSDKTRILLICDHASNIIPSKYANEAIKKYNIDPNKTIPTKL